MTICSWFGALARATARAVVVVSLVAGCGTDTSVTPAPPSPAPAGASTAGASPSAEGLTHVLSDASDGAIGITVSLPSPGWTGEPGGWAMERLPEGFEPPAGVVVDDRIALLNGGCYADTPPEAVDELHAVLSSATFD
jgi:hypothetical protein